ncbi:twin-arginine translocation signal domain-containing protein [Terasakiella sp. SH-1]|uniref:twin-arginine translocation signal domain-containing protein n=1 Tax=Terasakiella sp. SH-1 TaxID=2560057 RepID=UPI001074941A|nr:twin-arginine translocation signal domain-containing protein [Terasakiella sp. SH-1]
MDQKEDKADMGRRGFLKVATVGAAAGAAVIATSKTAQAADLSADADKASGYAETDHVAKYYELANF